MCAADSNLLHSPRPFKILPKACGCLHTDMEMEATVPAAFHVETFVREAALCLIAEYKPIE